MNNAAYEVEFLVDINPTIESTQVEGLNWYWVFDQLISSDDWYGVLS